MKLAVAGINHRTAPVDLREKLAFTTAEMPAALAELQAHGAAEALLLSTCNRVELTAVLDNSADSSALVQRFVAGRGTVPFSDIQPHLYTFEDTEAIRHLFRVAASLDSMVVGEPQILGQLKQAFSQAREQGTVGNVLETVLSRAFHVAKRIRTETEIGQSAVSVSYAAVEMAREIFGSLSGKRVLVIGAGKMSEGAARHLLRAGAAEILITNRSTQRARHLAELFCGEVVPYDSFPQRLGQVDIVLASSGAAEYVITPAMVERALEARKNQPMFFIDIAVPRNIDPAVNAVEHAFLFNIDDLQQVTDRNRKARQEEARQAETIVNEEVLRLQAKLRTRDVTPTILGLQGQLELIRQETLDRFRPKLGPLSIDQEEALDGLTRAIVNKIAHGPISEIRRHAASAHADDAAEPEVLSAVRRMFRLRDRS